MRIGDMEELKHLFEGNDFIYSQEKVDMDKRLNSYVGKALSKGSIYRAFVPFDSDSSKYKLRPVILLEDSSPLSKEVEVLLCTTAITKSFNIPSKNEYKLYQIPQPKYPILNWRANGFDSPAYVVISKNRYTNDYFTYIKKEHILEPMNARNYNNYNEFLIDDNQYEEILEYIGSVKQGRVSPKNPKADPKSESFDWKTMQIPKEAWEEYRNKSLAKDKEKEETRAIQKEERLKQEFKNLRLYYLYDKDSKAVGDMSYSARIFKGDKPKRYKVTRDWKTYETYMGKYFPIIDSIEIEDKFYSKLPTMNKEETLELKEHILSDEELKIFLEESL